MRETRGTADEADSRSLSRRKAESAPAPPPSHGLEVRRSAVAAPFDDAGYLHVADRIQRLLDVLMLVAFGAACTMSCISAK